MDEVVAYRQTVGGVVGVYYPHYNHLYSVAALTNGAGQVVERYSYDAYGKQTIKSATGVVRQTSAVGFDRGFTGYVADNETGLLHARARQYSPTLGRFVGRDPWRGSIVVANDGLQYEGLPMSEDGYCDGYSLYAAYFAPKGIDPDGTIDMGDLVDEIVSNSPAETGNGRRLDVEARGVELCTEIFLSIFWKESTWDERARNPRSSATGLGQILDRTADDIQDRLNGGRNLGGQDGRFRDNRTNPGASAHAANLYLRDRIAAAGYSLVDGLDRYGTGPGTDYGKKVLAGAEQIRLICECKCVKPGSTSKCCTYEELRACAQKNEDKIRQALDRVVR